MPNLQQVYPYLKEFRGTEYGAPTDGSLNGILYRTDPDWEPSTWMDLLADKKGTDRIGFEGSWYIYPFEVAANSLDQAEGIGELYEQQYHDAIYERMREFAQNVELWTGSFAEIQSSLRQRIIDMTMWYSGMGNAAVSQGDSLGFTTPDETAGYLDHYCPVRGTDKRRMTEDFLDHMLDAEVQTEWAKQGYVYVSNPEATYPERVRDQYPQDNAAWRKISIADFTELSEYSSTFSEEFQAIQNA
ncbi:hypothetical protein BRC86_07105 [Halobacteriales archaeon QS_3_64_16]|nr:MAG: hypothetical protein BRC86_07105 [Halobacteriales archaeon QS_3_64_16]